MLKFKEKEMASLDDLLKYKEKVVLKNPRTGKNLKTVWVRVLGDDDLKESFRLARIVSAAKRAALRNPESDVYKDEILALREESRENLEQWILTSRENIFSNEAPVVVVREDLPDIETIAAQPDAPTLEEQERLDEETNKVNDKFREAVEDYIKTKLEEVKAELAALSQEELIEKATEEYINIQSLQAFLEEVTQQQAYRGTYIDEECKTRGFSSFDAFKNSATSIKQQLIDAYRSLEIGNDEIKN